MSILNMLLGGAGGGDVITEYETGVYTPPEDYYRSATIYFSNAHTRAPDIIYLADNTGLSIATGEPNVFLYTNWDTIFGGPLFSSQRYGEIRTAVQSNISFDTATDYQTYADETKFKPRVSTLYYRSNRTYKWIAIWLPSE